MTPDLHGKLEKLIKKLTYIHKPHQGKELQTAKMTREHPHMDGGVSIKYNNYL